MSAGKNKGDDYYPFRWKVADFAENIVILYRTQAAAAIAALGIIIVLIGVFLLGWRPFSSDDTATAPDQAEVSNDDTPEVVDDDADLDDAPIDGDTDDSGGAEPDADDTEPEPESNPFEGALRPVATDEELQFTRPGTVIELGATVMRLVGGFNSDASADASFEFATELFPTREVFDGQLLSEEFTETDEIIIRLAEPGLFPERNPQINFELEQLFVDAVAAIEANPGRTVQVVGHAQGGPLSVNRATAVADELISRGIDPAIVTSVGLGDSEPIPEIPDRVELRLR